MTVSQDKVVSISYQLNLDAPDGEFVQKVEADDPLAFIYGIGQLLPDFEKNIAGLKVGDGFEFNIPQGYGAFIQENVIDVPISIFVDENGEPVSNVEEWTITSGAIQTAGCWTPDATPCP